MATLGSDGHAFLVGRLSSGVFFWHDQGYAPPRVYHGDTARHLIDQVAGGGVSLMPPVEGAASAHFISFQPLQHPAPRAATGVATGAAQPPPEPPPPPPPPRHGGCSVGLIGR
jgi:hypothetical protein